MKKLFTLLAFSGLMAFGAQAKMVDPATLHYAGINPAFEQKMNGNMKLTDVYNSVEGRSKVQKRTYEQGNYIYDLYVTRYGKLTDIITLMDDKGNAMTHEQYPFYVVVFQMTRATKTDPTKPNTEITAFTTWPSYRVWKNVDDIDNAALSSDMVSLKDFMADPAGCKVFKWNNFSTTVNNFLPAVNASNDITNWPVWSNVMDVTQTYNGTSDLTFTTDGSRATGFTLQDIDFDTEKLVNPVVVSYESQFPFDFYFSNGNSVSGVYKGEAQYAQFEPIDFDLGLSEIHIFNAGPQNMQNNADFDVSYGGYMEPWKGCTEVQKFYFWGVNDKATLGYTSNNETIPFDADKIQVRYEEGNFDFINYLRGSLFSTAGTEKPTEQKWTLIQPIPVEYDFNGEIIDLIGINPMPQSMLPGGYGDDYLWTVRDGMEACCSSYIFYPNIELIIANGTTEGLLLEGRDQNDNTYNNAPFTGKIVYHYDPKNMRLTEEINSVGNFDPDSVKEVAGEENATVIAENGVISVACGNAANVAIYTIDGQVVANTAVKAGETFTVNGANGLYIVKVGKTACKVML